MAGYLDNYGAGDERRARNLKVAVISVIGFAVLSAFLYFFFHNYREEHQVKRFYQLLAARDYQAAYGMWVSSDQDRRDYTMESFMQDWGPSEDVHNFDILDAESCGKSVIVDADLGPAGEKKVWVKRENLLLGSPPYDQCIEQNRINNLYRNIKYRLHGRTYK